jgi:hypothetical protein
MKKFIQKIAIVFVLTICLFMVKQSKAQYNNYTTNNIGLSLIEPGFGLEYSIAPKSTIKFRTAITTLTTAYKQQVLGMDDYFISYTFHPIASLAYRNYYNIAKRDNNRRRTDYNSANYFSLSAMYLFKNLNEPSATGAIAPKGGFIPAVLWGIQRSFNKRMFFDVNIGPGYKLDESKIIPMTELTFGIHL